MMPPDLLLAVSAAVHEAHTSGLLGGLLDGPAPAGDHAARAGLSADHAERVLDLLVGVGLAAVVPGDEPGAARRYGASATWEGAAARVPGGAGLQREIWSSLGAALRGAPTPSAWTDRPGRYARVVRGLGALWGSAPETLAEAVGPGFAVIDVGCGGGVWGRALTRPGGLLLGVDSAPVLAQFSAAGVAAGAPARHAEEGLAGDMHTLAVPPGAADRVVLANVLRLEPPERAATLLRRWAGALQPGGRFVVVDALAGGTPEAELARAAYALHLGLRVTEGRVHPPEALRAWMCSAGLQNVRAVPLPEAPGATAALVGEAPC